MEGGRADTHVEPKRPELLAEMWWCVCSYMCGNGSSNGERCRGRVRFGLAASVSAFLDTLEKNARIYLLAAKHI